MKFSHALLVVLALHVIAVGGVFAFNSIKAGQAAAAKNAAKEEIARAVARTSTPTKALGAGQRHRGVARPNPYGSGGRYTESARFALQDHHRGDRERERHHHVFDDPCRASAENSRREDRNYQARNRPSKRLPPSTLFWPRNPTCPSRQLPRLPNRKLPNRPPSPPRHRPSLSPNPAAPVKEEVPAAPTDGNTYTVAKGDNPYSIAKKLHVSYNELIAINEIKDPTRVQIGQKLKIPPRKN